LTSYTIYFTISVGLNIGGEMIKLEKAKAMKCFGRLVETIELDPDPNAQDEQTEAFNCKECEFHEYCCKLANTLS